MLMTSSRGSVTRQVHCQSDGEVRDELVRLVDSMTSTGQRSLDDKSVRALKQLCRYACSMSSISRCKIGKTAESGCKLRQQYCGLPHFLHVVLGSIYFLHVVFA